MRTSSVYVPIFGYHLLCLLSTLYRSGNKYMKCSYYHTTRRTLGLVPERRTLINQKVSMQRELTLPEVRNGRIYNLAKLLRLAHRERTDDELMQCRRSLQRLRR